jgi:tRNA pseudouridine55 synthase
MTSHDVVARVRRVLQERSVGHLGTLDPMATGVLPMLLGRYTRLAQFFGDSEKEYAGVIRFGFSTDTYDAAGQPTNERTDVNLSAAQVQAVLEEFIGEISQVPPPFSAKKIGGTPAYKLARKKAEFELTPVRVTVHEFRVTELGADTLSFTAKVSSGTYVRSLAHDLGRQLGCGAHLGELRRTRSGDFTLDHAVSLEQLEELTRADDVGKALLSPRSLLRQMANVTANGEQLAQIRNGNACNLAEFSQASHAKVFAGKDELVAIATRVAGTLFRPKVVLG